MNIRWNILIVGIVGTVVGFLLEGQGPIGSAIWPPPTGMPEPEGTNMALLIGMGIIEAVAFGAGCAFAVAAWGWAKARSAGAWTWPVYLGITWMLVNWVPHTALHIAHGNILTPADFGGLVAIEYGFHFTLILAGLATAVFCVRSVAVGAGRGVSSSGTGAAPGSPRKST